MGIKNNENEIATKEDNDDKNERNEYLRIKR